MVTSESGTKIPKTASLVLRRNFAAELAFVRFDEPLNYSFLVFAFLASIRLLLKYIFLLSGLCLPELLATYTAALHEMGRKFV